jgi:hypothetical protein
VRYAPRHFVACVCEPKISHHILGLGRPEVPIVELLVVHGPYRHTLGQQIANKLTTDKASRPSYESQLGHSQAPSVCQNMPERTSSNSLSAPALSHLFGSEFRDRVV